MEKGGGGKCDGEKAERQKEKEVQREEEEKHREERVTRRG